MTGLSAFSRPARWRIATLVFVHVAIAAHIVHWRLAGRSLSSIQLSDAGRFAAEGVVTAALLLMVAVLVATMVFGRFFCAWGCHMLAFQEACRFALTRLGIRPRLIRLRLLWVVPLVAAFYIFFFPAVQRLWLGVPLPTPQLELTSENLWTHLPGPTSAVLTFLVCGVLMVYFLGSLSFCKYVCPYGALFALADQFSLGRIRLIGDCDGCARCTAACTTGVQVHAEVQRLSMVANSGCMRCFECVSACPQRVLAYRFGRPALTAGTRTGLTPFPFTLGEEALVLGLCAAAFLALHGLYDRVPLLLALGASVIAGYCGAMVLRLLRQPVVALRGIALKQAGTLSAAGRVFAAGCVILLGFLIHSAGVQYHHWQAVSAITTLGFPQLRSDYSNAERGTAATAAANLERCVRYGLVETFDDHMRLAWLGRALGESHRVERHLRRAADLDPTQPAAHFNLGKELARQGRSGEAAVAFASAVRLAPHLAAYLPPETAAVRTAVAR
ncbi:4Fe-4S binding protein [Candidatus Binatia bacterium]|nr:4Fe-4S binding protein [Candidatus Binatia bacterium]